MDTIRKIEILGPGCSRCTETYRVVQQVVADAGASFEVTKDDSIERMLELGLVSTPGVAVDGKVVLAGRIPRAGEVRQLLGIEQQPSRAASTPHAAWKEEAVLDSKRTRPDDPLLRPPPFASPPFPRSSHFERNRP